MPASERMDPVDITWLRMDRPTNLMVIVGILMLAGGVGSQPKGGSEPFALVGQ